MSGNYSGATAAAGGMNPARKKVKRKIHPLFSRGVMDLSFFLIIMTLLVIGIIMMFSASYAWALNESGGESGTGYAFRQTIMAVIGLGALCFFSFFLFD